MKARSLLLASLCTVGALLSSAQAKMITTFTDSVSTSSATQLGRLSRNSVAQSWTGQETYPGIVNATTTYYYKTYTFSASAFTGAPYVDITAFDELNSVLFFVSAYANTYNPANKALNWLGDAGMSGNYFGVQPLFFDIVLPSNSSLVLVVNTTGGGTSGTGFLYDIAVNAYADTMFSDPVPEPATWMMVGTGLLGGAGAMRRRLFAAA